MTGANFDGLGQGFTGPAGPFTGTAVPPDPNAAVGANQIVELVNTGFAVFDKSGTTLYGPAATNTLFSGFDDDEAAIENHWEDGQMDLGMTNLKTLGPSVSMTESARISTFSWASAEQILARRPGLFSR